MQKKTGLSSSHNQKFKAKNDTGFGVGGLANTVGALGYGEVLGYRSGYTKGGKGGENMPP